MKAQPSDSRDRKVFFHIEHVEHRCFNKFKMYAGFNGEFRRKPVVSIRGVGASKKETKEDLVKRLKEERAEREVSYFGLFRPDLLWNLGYLCLDPK